MSNLSHVNTWIFDLDDTLYAPETGFSKASGELQMYVLCKLFNKPETEVKPFLLSLREKYGAASFTGLHYGTDLDMDAFIDEGFCLDASGFVEKDDYICEMFKSLNGRKVVYTNSPINHTDSSLRSLGFESIVDEVFTVERTNFYTKPMQESFDIVMKELSADPKACLMVEDRLPNLKRAKELGMTTVYVHGDQEKPEYVDYKFDTIKEFLEFANKGE